MKITHISSYMNNPYCLKETKKKRKKNNHVGKKEKNEDSVFISNEAKELYKKSVQP